ncbi:MAG: indolepyruvate oxidoreductase subunit beta [Methanomassiliicoccales archaeon]|nr:MAG: indolepyruvate oxidoreductase subunit beta [Methanomassiliicoccales archaeon]
MNEEGCKNLVVVGVGGQGIILVSRIIGEAALKSGLNVMVSEIHGMAQRGGMVVSKIRIGDVHSPMIGKGEADMILGFEPVETYRHLDMASEKTTIVTSVNPIYPHTESAGENEYPDLEGLLGNLEGIGKKLVRLDTEEMASSAGLPVIVSNIIMLGALFGACKNLPVRIDTLKETIKENVPSRFMDANIRAFELGFEEAKRVSNNTES